MAHVHTKRLLAVSLVTVVIILAFALSTTGPSAAGHSNVALPGDAVPGELVVGFHDDSSLPKQRWAVAHAGGEIDEPLESIDAAVVTARKSDVARVGEKLARTDGVDYVEPNYVVKSARLPNDPAFHLQWGLRDRHAAAKA